MALRKRSFIVLGFGAVVLLAACGGKIVDIGGQSTSQTLTPSAVTVAENACADGYEHSNICCTGGDKDTTPTCEAWPDSPFHPCPDGWTTYPNAAQCCSLSNPADCSSCSGDAGDSTPPSTGTDNGLNQPADDPTTNACGPTSVTLPEPIDGGPYADAGPGDPYSYCDSRCPPGYTGISPYDPQGCCQYNADGSGECFGEARAGSSPGVPDDAGVIDASTDAGPAPDAGVNPGGPEVDAGTDYPPPPVCDISCPDGWFLADAAGGVCCNNGANGDEECFAVVFPGDNGGSGGADVPGSDGSGPPQTIDAGSAPSH